MGRSGLGYIIIRDADMTEAQIRRGGLDELGENLIRLLQEIRPPSF